MHHSQIHCISKLSSGSSCWSKQHAARQSQYVVCIPTRLLLNKSFKKQACSPCGQQVWTGRGQRGVTLLNEEPFMLSRWSPSERRRCALSILLSASLRTHTLISSGRGTNSTQLRRLQLWCFKFHNVINGSHPLTSC